MEKYNLEQTGQEVQNILNEATPQSELTAETERAQEAERLLGEGIQHNADDIDAIEGKIPSAATSENKLTDKEYVDGQVDNEKNRAQDAEGTLQDNIDAEESRAKAAEKQNADDIDALEAVVPSGATSENKLATESYVNDAVATSSATFRGTFNLVSDLHLTLEATHANIATALAAAIATADNNDFAFVLIPTDAETPTVIGSIERYKYNGTDWAYEYTLNNSGFTQAQWDAINSGITSNDVTKLAALPTNAQLTTLLAGLQSDIDGEEARAKAAELAIQGNIDAEETRAKAAEKQNADDIDAIEDVLPETASSENKVATESEINSLSAAIEAILLLIPSAATSLNKLADKAYVNSSIATATATFRGTYNLVNDLGLTTSATHAQIATALAGAILTADNNDYAFVQIPTSDAMPTEIAKTERYKFNGTAWEYEYDLNNSGFTADQWAAINSGITQALVTKLAALPTNAQLTTELGTLTSGITTINQKIPAAASQANKLIDTAAMESYIVEVLNVLTISYNVTSTDGHVTLSIEQVDGKITSVTLTTSDIASAAALNLKASQADLTALEGRVTTAESFITSHGVRISQNEADIAILQDAYAGLTQSDIIIGSLPGSGVRNKIYRVPGTTSYSDYMWNGSTWVLMATYNNAIDPRPKKASQNLVTSGGVFDNMGALDVSELNATENPHTIAKYVDLSAALAAIPTDYQKGGMSIKFVQSSDNNYIRYNLLADSFTTDTTKWAIAEEGVYVENPEFIYVKTDSEGKILWAIRTDGTIYYGAGVPPQIIDYINEKIAELSLDEYEDIVAFLDEIINKQPIFSNKKVSIIGDSISTFAGYIPEGYLSYYPTAAGDRGEDVTSVEDTWWKRLVNATSSTLEVNASYSGSTASNLVKGFSSRVPLLGTPDIIIVALGTNDSWRAVPIGNIDFNADTYDLNQFAPAYIKGIKDTIASYPYARIICLAFDMGTAYQNTIKTIADHYSLEYIYVGDISDVHPNKAEMQAVFEKIYNTYTLSGLLANKVDKEEGKSLIDAEYANGVRYIENPEFIEAKTDAEDKILEATEKDGTKVFGGDVKILGSIDINGVNYKVVSNPEWLKVVVDAEDRVIYGIKTDGRFVVYIADFLDDIEAIKARLEELDAYSVTENPEFIEVELDANDKVLGGRKVDGTKFENNDVELNGNATVGGSLEVNGVAIKNIEDPEGRHEITVDSEDKVVSYRKEDGTKVEKVGFESPSVSTDKLNLSESGMTEFQQDLNDSGFRPSTIPLKEYNLPKYGSVDIISETFYLTADTRYTDRDGVVLIRDYEDTDENARNHITLDYFYIKSTLTDNGDGTYSKNANSVKLDFYPAGKVAKVSDKFYVLASLGEGGTVLPASIEVTQLTDIPHINAWPVNKKDEHYCDVTIDFGHYLTGTFKMGVKFQGSGTLNYRKKNFRFTFYKSSAKPYYPYDDDKFGKKEKIKIGEFVRTSGYNLKANWLDGTRIKEYFMCILFMAIWENRGSYESYPWEKSNPFSGATGMIKGFPIEVYVGENFYGFDIFGLKKDKANYLLSKDKDGMLEGGTRGNPNDPDNWTNASPGDWEDEVNDEEDWDVQYPSGNGQTASNDSALKVFFDYINGRMFENEDGVVYLSTQVTEADGNYYVTGTDIKVVNIPFDRNTMPDRMGIPYWIDYFICMQVFVMIDNTCRNMMLYTDADKKKFYPFFYDLDLSSGFNSNSRESDIMQPGVAFAADMSLWENFKNEWWDEIINRYHELRHTVLNVDYMNDIYKTIIKDIPDGISQIEGERWNTNVNINGFASNIKYLSLRLDWLDSNYFI